ncbi:helix-turn-helix domain-containing protein [Rubrivirga sp. IMCC43871]|uniref:AlbA family DNA-binding domain-containing protein n=1 Tax=Rubrivirga sp. IMCC43871 TaxID=3391575 RepID=UPI00398FDA11
MTTSDLRRLAAMGEGRHLEFKNRVPRPERIAREVIALANTAGGKVLLGVDDDGTVIGVKDAQEEFFALQQALADRILPPVDLGFEPVRVSRTREALVVHVPASPDRPHVLKPDRRPDGTLPKQRAFVRVADQSVEASKEAVALMRAEARGDAVTFTFGEPERKLLAYLERHERITVREYATLNRMPPWRASKALVTLALAGIVTLHPREGGEDVFTAGATAA